MTASARRDAASAAALTSSSSLTRSLAVLSASTLPSTRASTGGSRRSARPPPPVAAARSPAPASPPSRRRRASSGAAQSRRGRAAPTPRTGREPKPRARELKLAGAERRGSGHVRRAAAPPRPAERAGNFGRLPGPRQALGVPRRARCSSAPSVSSTCSSGAGASSLSPSPMPLTKRRPTSSASLGGGGGKPGRRVEDEGATWSGAVGRDATKVDPTSHVHAHSSAPDFARRPLSVRDVGRACAASALPRTRRRCTTAAPRACTATRRSTRPRATKTVWRRGHAGDGHQRRVCHTAGGLHGSGYFKLLDDAAFFAAQSMNPTHFVVTTSFTSYITKVVVPAKVPTLTSTGTVTSSTRASY